MKIFNVIILSMICEAIWETIKLAIPCKLSKSVDKIGVMALGVLLSISSGLDFLSLLGIPLKIPFIGFIFTGLLVSRGSNFMHDILASINNVQQNTKSKKGN